MEYRDEVYFDSQPEPEPPFDRAEFAWRRRRVREQMERDGIATLVVSAPESMFYLTGYQCEWYQAQSPRQWPAGSCTAIRVDDDRVIHFDTEREAALGRIFACPDDTRFFPRTNLRDGAEFVVSELAREGWLRGPVGIEMWSYRPNRPLSHRFQGLLEAAGATVIDGTQVLREVRWLKSHAEMACLVEAARIADIGIQAAADAIAPGVTELEVYGEMVRAMAAAGGENPAITMPVLSGMKTNAAHALSTRRVIGQGEVVTVDVCGVVNRYHANAARTFHTGEPPPDLAVVAAAAAGSIEVVRSLLRPGLPVRELNETLFDYYRDAGLWASRGWIGGYEMGIAFYGDWVGNFVYDPLAELNADRVFESGTAVNCETQIFLPRHAGLFFAIDTLLFSDHEARVASALPATLGVL
jgi:Xaa-Pro aminopeptidase